MRKRVLIFALTGLLVVGAGIVGGTRAARNVSTKDNSMTSEGVITTNDLQIDLEQEVLNDRIYANQPVEVTYTVCSNEGNGYDCFTRLLVEKETEFSDSVIEIVPVGVNAGDWIVVDPLKNYEKIAVKYQNLASMDDANSELYRNLAAEYSELAEQYQTYDQTGLSEDYIYLYYRKGLSSGERVACNLQLVFSTKAGIDYSTNPTFDIDVKAEAVQTFAAEAAIPSEWGMFVELNGDGNEIVRISDLPFDAE